MKADLSQVRGKIIIPQMAIGSCRDDKYNPIEMLYHHLTYTPVLGSPPTSLLSGPASQTIQYLGEKITRFDFSLYLKC